ncbi:hypothetical protein CRG98_044976 [Punica granatum]|uniref:Uncharacterized protein n=1 Tax=Punica granatum TaxID=22663 RepID=A0A2I0HSQ9_PUNGR|nr:hypothetical protein CRG98_044976 [Punica granatum]
MENEDDLKESDPVDKDESRGRDLRLRDKGIVIGGFGELLQWDSLHLGLFVEVDLYGKISTWPPPLPRALPEREIELPGRFLNMGSSSMA